VEYLSTEKKTYLFIVTRSADRRKAKAEVQVFTLNVSAKELSERTANFRQQLASRDLLYRQTAIELYELLLGPARELLKDKRLLTIVPDGALWEMPFQALQPTPGHHLIEDSAIAYGPSLTVLRDMNKARAETRVSAPPPPMSLLAVGNPVLGTQSVERLNARLINSEPAPLPEAEDQVRALQRLYGAEHSKVYVGLNAREEQVKAEASKYRILHLATHGVYDDAAPMYSHVVLANEAANAHEDGFLEAWEIMNLDLHADLVVLSACETARGRVGAGEGMIGLAWSLFVAGSPSTLVSQWKVDAASTTTLMLEFHRRMRAGNSKARALQQATLKTLQNKEYRHPFYWAPFVLVGDAN
jgi:CHAT domain-containing protein